MSDISSARACQLQIESIELVGGSREIRFNPDFSIVRGSITTGKTTLVRLLKAMLGRVPDHLPPEVGTIRSVRGQIRFDSESWTIDRPLVTTQAAMVSLSRYSGVHDELAPEEAQSAAIIDALRLPAIRPTASEDQTYQQWMLLKLDIPEVSVPRARTDASSALTPVTINDWLMYCIVRDDELDTEIFGHKDQFADRKRRAVFELNYGVYDSELANLQANYRGVELRLEDLERTAAAVTDFLNATPFQSLDRIDSELQQAQDSLLQLEQQSADLATQAHSESTSLDIRRQIAKIEASLGEQENELQAALKSFADLTDLRSTLSAQSQRLIRAIVADEWLVDFDFIVCPRCGTEIDDSRTSPEQCYLCLQAPQTGDFHSELIKEQERIASQVIETNGLLVQRESEISGQQRAIVQSQAELEALHRDLNLRTAHFVSAHSDAMTSLASGQARLREEIQRLLEYRDLVVRFNDLSSLRSRLEEERSDLSEALKLRVRHSEEAERLIGQLESRFQEYLERLHISLSDLPLIASINRTTYLPEIGGRAFDTLSSQGLSVLVNVAHALAHHTVSIDEGLPLPSLLILDGLSSNVGHEGFDLERRDDTYRLLIEETERYGGRLQVIALDNDVPSFGRDSVVLTLTTEDRLVRSRVKTNV